MDLQSKRADLVAQVEQYVGQINRANGAIALIDDLIAERQAEEADAPRAEMERHEVDRLRSILRSCVYGAEVIDLGDGEFIGLHLPNKNVALEVEAERTGFPKQLLYTDAPSAAPDWVQGEVLEMPQVQS